MEQRYNPMEQQYNAMEHRYDRMEQRCDPIEQKSLSNSVFVQNAPPPPPPINVHFSYQLQQVKPDHRKAFSEEIEKSCILIHIACDSS